MADWWPCAMRTLDGSRTPPPSRAMPASVSPPTRVTGFDQMLRETSPDCVIVTVPDHAHCFYIVRALELGSDVITEKPLTIDAEVLSPHRRGPAGERAHRDRRLQLPLLAGALAAEAGAHGRDHRRCDRGPLRVAARYAITAPTTSAAGTATRPTPAACSCTRPPTTSTWSTGGLGSVPRSGYRPWPPRVLSAGDRSTRSV